MNLSLFNGETVIVDDKDFERFKDSKWYRNVYGYAIRNAGFGRKGRRSEMLHQLIMGKSPKGCVIDHINCNPLDNRRANLRFVTRAVNNLNSSVRKNVERHQGHWQVRFGLPGQKKQIRVSGIETREEAISIAALLRGALIYHELTKGDRS